ncbi:alpha-amylase AmyA [Aspergillus heteromorphus CBS 117.55]|uniref:Alpha-amylase n=1 Tax=Aspergillus heteromorphus CBS 117.55 TaxID=1448321 RepID=A0A317WYT5_9EURO|nr:alpha-amylase AmyA [Aspergillus heteromorphus CBS 117.55]PWY91121.1 alpha-amylase AmyA [Aspergillus heteromorphus CBS 117.55]
MSLPLRHVLRLCVIALDLSTPVLAASTGAWSSRSVYQTMTDRFARTDGSTTHPCNTTDGLYCGGTWRGMINHLDYIEGMGFDAVMISPIVKNIEGRVSYGEAYHGYWPQDLYALNPRFGTQQDLLDLSQALHDRGMYLMMDTVINNMAYFTNGTDPSSSSSIDYAIFNPFNDPKYFHPYCQITDYNNYPLAQSCWTGDDIVALPDLKTEDPTVQAMLSHWVQEIMTNYSIDGLRLDAAKHVTPDFLPQFQKAALDSFVTGEVFDQSVDTICSYQNDLTSVPNYPIYYALLDAFTKGNTSTLPNRVEIMKHTCPNVTTLTSFSENHDVARFASLEPDINLAKNLLTFTLLSDGIPMIYQGQEQHLSGPYDPLNREALWLTTYNTTSPLYTHISTLNALRKHASQVDPNYLSTQTYPIYTGSSEMGFRKGREGRQVVMVLSTQGSASGAYTIRMTNGYEPSFVVMDVFTCRNYTVNDMGELRLDMDGGEPRVLYPPKQHIVAALNNA